MTWAAAPAVVSVLAAVMAFISAIWAGREAHSITTLNHKVAALDRQAEQIRDDYRDLIKAIAGISESIGRNAEVNVTRRADPGRRRSDACPPSSKRNTMRSYPATDRRIRGERLWKRQSDRHS